MTNSSSPLNDTGAFRTGRKSAGFRRILESIMHVGRDVLARRRQSARRDDEPAEALGTLFSIIAAKLRGSPWRMRFSPTTSHFRQRSG